MSTRSSSRTVFAVTLYCTVNPNPNRTVNPNPNQVIQVYQQLINAEMAGVQAKLSHGEYLRNEARRGKIQRAWGSFFEEYDAFICPAMSTAAPLHDHSEPMHKRSVVVNGMEVP